tara:strand:- start:17 stop:289 length:273 start_codon:yes stop_codon:yes gene_type:complete
MKESEITKIKEKFRLNPGINHIYDSPEHGYGEKVNCEFYSHDEYDFVLYVIDADERHVYQGGTEADTIGVELDSYKDLEIRFKSFTGINL